MSNNLDIAQVAASQNNKEVTINDGHAQIDAALTGIASYPVDDSNALTLTSEQLRRAFFHELVDDATPPDAAVTVTVPALQRGLFVVFNTMSQSATVEISGQAETAPTIASGGVAMLHSDGADVREASAAAGLIALGDLSNVTLAALASGQMIRFDGSAFVNEDTPYDVVMFLAGALDTAGGLLAQFVLDRDIVLPSALAGSQAYASIAATAETVLDLRKNGGNVGTITFAAGTNPATLAMPSQTTFTSSDRLEIINQDPADATLADVSITLKATRS